MAVLKRYKQLQFDLDEISVKGEGKVTYNGIPARQVTFKSGLEQPVHRWFRLTPSFGPDLVNEILNSLGCNLDDVILDPFAGAGTTLIECQINQLDSFGFEINPFLHFVCNTSLNWDLNYEELKLYLDEIGYQYKEFDQQFTELDLENGILHIPRIHDPYRWWRKDVLKKAIALKLAIQRLGSSQRIKDFFSLGLAGVLVPDLTNVTLGRLQLYFIDRSTHVIDVWAIFSKHVQNMIDDLAQVQILGTRYKSHIYHTDSTCMPLPKPPRLANLVITSPPYPNRYSYVWNTRPYLYFFDFFDNSRQAAELDKQTIGGTWGTATSGLMKTTVLPDLPIIKQIIGPVEEEIRQADNLMANYLVKYFNLLAKQIQAMDQVLEPHAKLAYVVGCSRLKGVYVETDVLLAKLMEGLGLGYRVRTVERIRRRHSGKNLHESIVYAER